MFDFGGWILEIGVCDVWCVIDKLFVVLIFYCSYVSLVDLVLIDVMFIVF